MCDFFLPSAARVHQQNKRGRHCAPIAELLSGGRAGGLAAPARNPIKNSQLGASGIDSIAIKVLLMLSSLLSFHFILEK